MVTSCLIYFYFTNLIVLAIYLPVNIQCPPQYAVSIVQIKECLAEQK